MSDSSSAAYPPLRLALLVWGLSAALYFVGFFHRVTPAVITRELMAEFALGAAALGNLSAFYFYSYVAMQIPTGLLVDHWGARRVLAVGAGVAALGTVAFALSPSYALACFGRLLIGASVGVAFVAMLKLAAHWFAPARFAMLSGFSLMIGMLGAISAGAPLRLLADQFGWRPVMFAGGMLCTLLCGVIWWVVRDDPDARGYRSYAPASGTRRPDQGVLWGLREVTRYRNVWLIFFVAGGFTGPMLTFAGLWGVPFLATHYAMSTAHAAALTSAMMLAWGAGGLALGALSDRLGRRKPVYVLGMVVSLAGWALLWLVPDLPRAVLYPVLASTGFFSGGVIISFAFAKESAPAQLAGTTSGFVNMGNMLGGMTMQPAVGWVLDRLWGGQFAGADGVRIYDFAAYRAGFVLMLAWLAIALVLLAFTRETYCRQASQVIN